VASALVFFVEERIFKMTARHFVKLEFAMEKI
jgi:hypothetical protein